MEKPYLTVEEIAKALGVTVETVRSYINRSKNKNPLPAFKIGRRWHVRTKDFEKWIQENMNIQPPMADT